MKAKFSLLACLIAPLVLWIGWAAAPQVPLRRDDSKVEPGPPTARAIDFPPEMMDLPPIEDPQLFYADEAAIDDEAMVIGIVVNGEARAYLRTAFGSEPERHVVTDEIESTPVAVTHCDRIGSTRVLVSSDPEEPLNLRCGGWREDQTMDLLVNGQCFSQLSPEIPLKDVPFLEMPWGMWREIFPDTLIYLGGAKGPESIRQPLETGEDARQSAANSFRTRWG